MGRPSLGSQAKSITVGVRFSPAEMEQIRKLGKPATVVRRLALESLILASNNCAEWGDEAVAASYNPNYAVDASENPADSTQSPVTASGNHRHRRERTGENWVDGTDVGTWICKECGIDLDP